MTARSEAYQRAVLSLEPDLYYPMQETSGAPIDATGTYTGSSSAPIEEDTGPFGDHCRRPNSWGDHVDAGTSVVATSGSADFALSLWSRYDGVTYVGYGSPLARMLLWSEYFNVQNDRWGSVVSATSLGGLLDVAHDVTGLGTLDGDWHCFVASRIDSVMATYMDGVLIDSSASTQNGDTKNLYFGGTSQTSWVRESTNGGFAHGAAWKSRGLTPYEARLLYEGDDYNRLDSGMVI